MRRKQIVCGLTVMFFLIALPARAQQEVRILTWNLEWFFDHDTSDDDSNIGRDFAAPSAQEFRDRVATIADAIATIQPTIVALQEIENALVVQALATELLQRHSLAYTVAFVQGRDTHTGQDVAFLVDSTLPFTVERFDFSEFAGEPDFKDLSKHLRMDVTIAGEPVTLVTVHLITQLSQRLRQARTLRAWTQELVPARNLIILGDFNSGLRVNETTNDSEMGIIRGFGTSSTDDDLFDAHLNLTNRDTHVSGRELDRILLSPSLTDTAGLHLTSIERRRDLAIRGAVDGLEAVAYELPVDQQDLSDHFPLIATLTATNMAPPPPPAISRADLLEAMQRLESELQRLANEVNALRVLVEQIPE